MAIEIDYFDSWDDVDDWGDEDGVTCKHCGEDYLHWEEARGERNQKCWMLMNASDEPHDCPRFAGAAPAVADEFPDLSKKKKRK